MSKFHFTLAIVFSLSLLTQQLAKAQMQPIQTDSASQPNANNQIETARAKFASAKNKVASGIKNQNGSNLQHANIQNKNYGASGFLCTTTSSVEGYTVLEYRGLVEGAAVRAPSWKEDSAAGMAEISGGYIDSYTHLSEECRMEAFNTMTARAKEIGANGILGIYFNSQVFPLDKGRFASAVVCVGTAVVVKPK